MMEILAGLVFAGGAIVIPQVIKKVSIGKLSFPKLKRKKTEEKMKEIDEQLDKVASEGIKKPEKDENTTEVAEKIVPLDDAAKNVTVEEDLLNEMETADSIKIPESDENDEKKLPELPELPELGEDEDIDTEDIEKEITLDAESEEDEEDEEEISFDEEDDLISSLAKEVEVKEEEEIDLLRDLKGKKFPAEELETELREVLQRLKGLAG